MTAAVTVCALGCQTMDHGGASDWMARYQSFGEHDWGAAMNAADPPRGRGDFQDSGLAQGLVVGDKSHVVADVIIEGNRRTETHHILRHLRTRPGRYFDPDLLQQDVNELWRMP